MSYVRKRCLVESCEDTDIKRSFHEFPADPSLREKWLTNLDLSECHKKLPHRAFVCSSHFTEDCFRNTFSGRKLLKHGVTPSLSLAKTFDYYEITPKPCTTEIPSISDLCSAINLVDYHIPNDTTNKSTQVDFVTREKVEEDKKEIKMLKMQIKRLTEKYELKTIKLQEMQKTINNANCEAVFKMIEDADNNNRYAIFLLDQILNYGNQKPRFSETTLRNCIMWRAFSPKRYEYCRSTLLKLPCRRTLQRYIGSSKDISQLITSRLTAEANSLKPIERVCSLIIDDMTIKEKLQYSRTDDKFYGLDTTKNSINFGKKPILANKMLCFVIHGLSTKFTIPAGYFFHRTMKTTDFHELTLKVLQNLHQCGFIVLRIVTDNHKSNVALFKVLGENKLLTRIKHPIEPQIPLFLSFDYCHAIKNARNIFLDRNMQSDEGTISSNYLKDLYKLQRKLIVKPVKFLTKKHLYPTNFEKMNVRRAVEIFSPPVTAAIKYLNKYQTSVYDFSKSGATTTYTVNLISDEPCGLQFP